MTRQAWVTWCVVSAIRYASDSPIVSPRSEAHSYPSFPAFPRSVPSLTHYPSFSARFQHFPAPLKWLSTRGRCAERSNARIRSGILHTLSEMRGLLRWTILHWLHLSYRRTRLELGGLLHWVGVAIHHNTILTTLNLKYNNIGNEVITSAIRLYNKYTRFLTIRELIDKNTLVEKFDIRGITFLKYICTDPIATHQNARTTSRYVSHQGMGSLAGEEANSRWYYSGDLERSVVLKYIHSSWQIAEQ